MSDYTPKPEHKFTFGLWTVGSIGRDPFGGPVRDAKSPAELVRLLGEVGAYGVNFHDNDLIPIDATPTERDQILKEFRQALADTGLVVPMATTNLFAEPVFKDGAFTSNDPKVRAYAVQKTMNAIDLGVELGAKIYVFWGGREGTETDAAKDPITSIKRSREAMNFLCEYVLDKKYDLKLALEAKPPMSRAATSTTPPPVTCWPLSKPSTIRKWSASIQRWHTNTWRGSISSTVSRRRWKRASCSTLI
jgi:xylose isomerase